MRFRRWLGRGAIIGAVAGVAVYALGFVLSFRPDGSEAIEGVALLLTQYTQPLSTLAWWIAGDVPLLGFVLLFLVVPAAWGAVIGAVGLAILRLLEWRRLTSA